MPEGLKNIEGVAEDLQLKEAMTERFNKELALTLLKKGVRFTTTTIGGDFSPFYSKATPIHCAYLNDGGNSEIFNYLLEQKDTDLNATCDEGTDEGSQVDTINEKGHFALEQATLLHWAVASGDLATVKKLRATKRVNLNARAHIVYNKDLLGQHSIEAGDREKKSEKNIEIIDQVYAYDEVYKVIRIKDVTPLHLAAKIGNKEIMAYLIAEGADETLVDGEKKTPKDYISDLRKGAEEYKKNLDVDELDKLFKEVKVSRGPRKRSRLIIGDGDYSYTNGLVAGERLAKRPRLGESIRATEYASYTELKQVHGDKLDETIKRLKELKVEINFAVDGTKMHEQKELKDERYKRIHFNFPHDKSRFQDRTLPALLAKFFQSAAVMQNKGGRVYMALPKPAEFGYPSRKFYQGYVYGIFEASAKAGYVLVKKRQFCQGEKLRYPGYKHSMTHAVGSAEITKISREYIFERRSDLSYEQILASSDYGPGGKETFYRGKPGEETRFYLKEPTTDNDSSNYEDSDASDDEVMSMTTAPAPSFSG